MTWDSPLPAALMKPWGDLHASIPTLQKVSLPRWVESSGDNSALSLHGFCDASDRAYGAAVYIRVRHAPDKVATHLIMGKSRVAPLKNVTIPRLELCAAHLLARLLAFVARTQKLEGVPMYGWSDSTVALCWLAAHPSRWKTFVANRVAQIQSLIPACEWRHVRTEYNSADCASRGIAAFDLATHPLWWHGPPWLSQDSAQWPSQIVIPQTDAVLEARTTAVHHVAVANSRWDLATRFSSWPTLLKVMAQIIRFSRLVRRERSTHAADSSLYSHSDRELMDAARKFWYKTIQRECYADEVLALSNGKPVPSRSSLGALNPFLDSDGLVRVGGRLRHSSYTYGFKHPVILAPHPVTELLVRQVHWQNLHAGPQLTLVTIRQTIWIPRGRRYVRSVIHKCVTCARERAVSTQPLMGDLPAPRVTPSVRCFVHCGVDYAGPLLVRTSAGRGTKATKAYVALFVCLSTRAVHIELVSDYSAAAFINALHRFTSRRGVPDTIYSDNGTTFVGAYREIRSAVFQATQDIAFREKLLRERINWKFIPPAAPNFGGLWEAGVKSVKHHLRRVIGSHTLTFEELSTLLCRIEACLNSRPIAPVSDAPSDLNVLTPGHFLIGAPLTAIPEPSVLEAPENRLTR